MNMQVRNVHPDASGGYKADASRGQRISRVSSKWFFRAAAERGLLDPIGHMRVADQQGAEIVEPEQDRIVNDIAAVVANDALIGFVASNAFVVVDRLNGKQVDGIARKPPSRIRDQPMCLHHHVVVGGVGGKRLPREPWPPALSRV